MFGQRTQIRPIGNDQGDRGSKGFGQQLAQRHFTPIEVRGEVDPTVAAADNPDDADTDPNQSIPRARPFQQPRGDLEHIRNRLVHGCPAPRPIHPIRAQNLAAKADDGNGQRTHSNLDGERHGSQHARLDE